MHCIIKMLIKYCYDGLQINFESAVIVPITEAI